MKYKFLPVLLVFICIAGFAQNQGDRAFMVPPKVYIGDRAMLILPLPGFTGREDSVIAPSQFPLSDSIEIHRAAIERRPGGNRLMVEFTAYVPGILELPPFEISGETFNGLKIEVSSILEQGISGQILSDPAPPLAIPGTSFLVYGTTGIAVLLLLTAFWALFRGSRQMKGWLESWQRRRLLVSMWGIEKRLRKALAKGAPLRETLDILAAEFRSFLGYFTGENCRAMTASELGQFTVINNIPLLQGSEFPGTFFSRCDSMRFSGNDIGEENVTALLSDLREFLAELGKAMRGKA